MSFIIACLLAYLIGSVPISPTPKAFVHADYAAFRTLRIRDILSVFMLDMVKGALAVIIAWMIAGVVAAHMAVIFVVLGEVCPCFPPRSPRNGWAVAAGALLVVSPILILISLCIYLFSLLITRTFVGSFLLAAIAFVICLVLFAAHLYLWILVICLAGMLTIHRPKWLRKGLKIRRWRR